ncbi:hypothetical protein [Gemmata sp.]|uniref:hypothetical protein n=1 Tax=Gemmata sp. TaxID=1914242 RepID=UPI003F7225B6
MRRLSDGEREILREQNLEACDDEVGDPAEEPAPVDPERVVVQDEPPPAPNGDEIPW